MVKIFLRTVILYFFVTGILRFTGKRQLGEMSPSELVTALLISNIVSSPIENPGVTLLSSLFPIVVIACLEIFTSFLSLKFPLFRRIISGRERYIIKNGIIDKKAMADLRISFDDLNESLRQKDIFSLYEVEDAVVEADGNLSVLLKMPFRPIANKDLDQIKKKG